MDSEGAQIDEVLDDMSTDQINQLLQDAEWSKKFAQGITYRQFKDSNGPTFQMLVSRFRERLAKTEHGSTNRIMDRLSTTATGGA